MLSCFDPLRDLTLLSVTVRMVLAFLCGGLIGVEREYKRRPAGFRTHILICLGAAMTTLTSQYLCLELHYDTDMARLGAQVKELEEKCQQPASELLQVRDTPPARGIGEGAHRKGGWKMLERDRKGKRR